MTRIVVKSGEEPFMPKRRKQARLLLVGTRPGPSIELVVLIKDLSALEGFPEEVNRFVHLPFLQLAPGKEFEVLFAESSPNMHRLLSVGEIAIYDGNDLGWHDWIKETGIDYVPAVMSLDDAVFKLGAFKVCQGCKRVLEAGEFHRNGPTRLDSHCKNCRNVKKKAQRAEVPAHAPTKGNRGPLVDEIPKDLKPHIGADVYDVLQDEDEE